MRLITDDQLSPEWFIAKLGCISGSQAWKAISGPKTQMHYVHQLAGQILTGEASSFSNAATRYGMDMEPQALAVYHLHTGYDFTRIGFALHDDYDKVGCSVDALTDDRVIEVKCPINSTYHIAHLMGVIERGYRIQCQFNMWITGKELCDFVSFDPRFPVKQRLYIKTYELDGSIKQKFEDEVPKILEQIDDILFEVME